MHHERQLQRPSTSTSIGARVEERDSRDTWSDRVREKRKREKDRERKRGKGREGERERERGKSGGGREGGNRETESARER